MNKSIIFFMVFLGQQFCLGMTVPPPTLSVPFDQVIAAAHGNNCELLKLLSAKYKNVCVMCNQALDRKEVVPVYGISSGDGKKIDLKLQELSQVTSDLESTSLNVIKFNVHKVFCHEGFMSGLSLVASSQELRIYQLAAGAIVGVLGIIAFIVFVAEVLVTYEG